MKLLERQQWKNRHREKTYRNRERRREGEIYGENNMEAYIAICKIGSQWEFTVCLRKFKQGVSINIEGWDGEGDGGQVQKGG